MSAESSWCPFNRGCSLLKVRLIQVSLILLFGFQKTQRNFFEGTSQRIVVSYFRQLEKKKKKETKADVKPNTKEAQVLFTSKLVKKVQALFNYHCYASDKGTGMLRVILNCLMFACFTQKCHVADLVQLCKSTRQEPITLHENGTRNLSF